MNTTSQWRIAFAAEREARMDRWSDIQGHLPFLYHSALARERVHVLELGTRWGTSTAVLLAAAEQVGGHVWSVDLDDPRVPSWWGLTGCWTLTVGDDLDPAVVAQQPEQVDLLLVDTIHDDYHHTLAELHTYVPRVKPGGLVCCHDTNLDPTTVDRDIPQVLPKGAPLNPVAQALADFCAEQGWEWANRDGSYGLGVVEVPS